MKKIKMTVMALLMSVSMNAQIDLEHTYNVSGSNVYLTVVQLANSGYKYVFTDLSQYQVKVYNTNHSLWKTITIPTVSDYTLSSILSISENLFNLDAQVECIANYYNYSTTPIQYYAKIINENGVVIKDLPNRAAGVIEVGSNTFKLNVSDGNLIREIYSLPGTSSNLGVSNPEFTTTKFAYPNPTSQQITLPYNLNGASAGVVKVYNLNGQVIETFNVDNAFNTILLDVSNYPSGMYRYGVVVNGVETSASFVRE